jgi:hypothetical protein
MCAAFGIGRQKMGDAKIPPCSGAVKWSNIPSENLWGVRCLGEAQRKAPAQAELRPTCAGPSHVNLSLIFTLWTRPAVYSATPATPEFCPLICPFPSTTYL